MKGNRLYKCEKLCSKRSIDALFGGNGSASGAIVYPLRVVYRAVERSSHYIQLPDDCHVQFLINVPKRKFKHAVDRVLLRRRIREAYRVNRYILNDRLASLPDDRQKVVEVAFMYLSEKKKSYASIEKRMQAVLTKIADEVVPTVDE